MEPQVEQHRRQVHALTAALACNDVLASRDGDFWGLHAAHLQDCNLAEGGSLHTWSQEKLAKLNRMPLLLHACKSSARLLNASPATLDPMRSQRPCMDLEPRLVEPRLSDEARHCELLGIASIC